MASVEKALIPENALIAAYRDIPGCKTDCFAVDVPGRVTLTQFVHVFFTGGLFQLERVLIGAFAGRWTSDGDVLALAQGRRDYFAMWQVEDRDDGQILMAVNDSPIRTWLMVETAEEPKGKSRLYFGSAVLPKAQKSAVKPGVGVGFRLLGGVHELYSRLLLGAAARGVRKRDPVDQG